MVAVLASCSTAYRTGQTPDDVYYSPAPVQSSYVSSVSDQDRNSYAYNNNSNQSIQLGDDGQSPDYNNYNNPITYYNDPITYDLGYGYAPYGYSALSYNPYFNSYGLGSSLYGYDPLGYMNFYNPFAYSYYGYSGLFGYNNPYSFYNPYSLYSLPYYGHSSSITYGTGVNVGPRKYNLNAYTNTNSTGTNVTTTPSAPVRRTSGVGNVIRRVFSPSRNNNYYTPSNGNRVYNNSNNSNSRTFNNEQSTPSRTFNNAPSVSTPSSSGNGSAPVRSFRR